MEEEPRSFCDSTAHARRNDSSYCRGLKAVGLSPSPLAGHKGNNSSRLINSEEVNRCLPFLFPSRNLVVDGPEKPIPNASKDSEKKRRRKLLPRLICITRGILLVKKKNNNGFFFLQTPQEDRGDAIYLH